MEDYVLAKSMADRLTADWKRLGMDGVYAFPEFFLRDSQRSHGAAPLVGIQRHPLKPQNLRIQPDGFA